MSGGFVHIHRHSEFSRLDGIGTAKQYADRAAELNQPALAQTDHGTLSGALHHIVACQSVGIVSISGVEAYFRPDRFKAKADKNTKAWHLCLSGDTEVVTRQGIKPIASLVGKAELLVPLSGMGGSSGLSSDGRGKFVEVDVKKFGTNQLVRIELQRNRQRKTVFATLDHRWYLAYRNGKPNKDSVPTHRLIPGDRLRSIRSLPPTKTEMVPFGVAQGFVYGDGTTRLKDRPAHLVIHSNGKDSAMLPYFAQHKILNITANDKPALQICGLPRLWRELPSLNESRGFLLSWLAGYFAADGCVSATGQAVISSASLPSLKFVRDVAAICGIGYGEVRKQVRQAALPQGGVAEDSIIYNLTISTKYLPDWFFLIESHRSRVEKRKPHRDSRDRNWKVVSVDWEDRFEEVYCAVVPEVHSFALADELLTGNCLFAKNLKGWHNLLKLVSTAYGEVEDGGGFYQVPCFPAGTMVTTPLGAAPIESLSVGDLVLTHRGRFRPVTGANVREYQGTMFGVQPNRKYGRTVWMTEEHPALIRDRSGDLSWTPAKDIMPGRFGRREASDAWNSWVCLPRVRDDRHSSVLISDWTSWMVSETRPGNLEKSVQRTGMGPTNFYSSTLNKIPLDEEFGYFLGAFVAEGNVSRGCQTQIHQNPGGNVDLKRCSRFAEAVCGVPVPVRKRNGRDCEFISVPSAPFAQAVEAWCRKGCHNKVLPEFALLSNIAFQRGLAKGVLDGDGSYRESATIFAQTSEALAWQMRTLMCSLNGDFSSIAVDHSPSGKNVYRSNFSPLQGDLSFRSVKCDEDYVYRPVGDLLQMEFSGYVYNISVEEDESYVTDFVVHNCVDWDLLERYHEGLVCSTACISSWLSNLVNLGHDNDVRAYIARMRKIFGDDLWIEIMPHDFDDQRTLNLNLVAIAQEFCIPIIATNDAHFPYKEWADTHRIAKMMGSGSSFRSVAEAIEKGKKPDYLAELNPTLYLSTETEMKKWFKDHHPGIKQSVVDESMSNTLLFAQTIKPFMLDKRMKLPKVTESIDHSVKIMQNWIKEGLAREVNLWIEEDGLNFVQAMQKRAVYQKRVDIEWNILVDKGVLDYFVMVGQIVRWCATDEPLPPCATGEHDMYPIHRLNDFKKRPIRVNIRGSASSCLISYLIGVVKIDPVGYGLLFERFLNPNRKGLPDIDMDFQSGSRSLVKEYIARLYGRDHVVDVVTHQRFQPKKVLADLARTFDIHYLESRKLTKPIEIRADAEETTLDEILPLYPHLQKFKKEHEFGEEIWKHGKRLEGTVANQGKHAAAVVITPKPVTNYMSLERGKKGDLVTSWSDAADFTIISDYGFVKLDALGLKGLEVQDYACQLIEDRTGKKVDLYALPALRYPARADPKVMYNFCIGKTVKVFQFGSRGLTKLLRAIKPGNILELVAANALYRPGPMKSGVTWDYPKRKNNAFLRTYLHPDLEEWLGETHGVIAFQEQVMQICKNIGRMSEGDTDDMRKAMGKLYRIKGGHAAKDFMGQYEVPFFEGAEIDHGWKHDVAEAVWNMFLEFGHYGFPKGHAASYSVQGYQDMWLKTYYPHEFYAAVLTFEDDEDEIKAVVREARSDGIDLQPPDLNTSTEHYNTDGVSLRLGLTAIKGMGGKTAKLAIKLRPFSSIEDLFERGKRLPHKQIIESGSVDSLEDRNYLLSVVTKPKLSGDNETWCVWEHIKHNVSLKNPRPVPKFRRSPTRDMLAALREASFSVPLRDSRIDSKAADYIRENCHLGDEFTELEEKARVVCGGEIIKVDFKLTKMNKQYANIRVVFESDQWVCKLWEEAMLAYEELLVVGNEVMIAGKKDIWNEFESVVVQEMVSMEEFMQEDEEEVA